MNRKRILIIVVVVAAIVAGSRVFVGLVPSRFFFAGLGHSRSARYSRWVEGWRTHRQSAGARRRHREDRASADYLRRQGVASGARSISCGGGKSATRLPARGNCRSAGGAGRSQSRVRDAPEWLSPGRHRGGASRSGPDESRRGTRAAGLRALRGASEERPGLKATTRYGGGCLAHCAGATTKCPAQVGSTPSWLPAGGNRLGGGALSPGASDVRQVSARQPAGRRRSRRRLRILTTRRGIASEKWWRPQRLPSKFWTCVLET